MKLTEHLCQLTTDTPYSAAVEADFLIAAGKGELPDKLLADWLAQDRIYAAHAYPRFIGALITKFPFSSLNAVGSSTERNN
jgi:hypothetical protein